MCFVGYGKGFGLAVGAALAALALGGCSSGASAVTQCPAFGTVIAPPTMISPANGATGVADGNFTLTLSASYGQSVALTTAAGGITQLAPAPQATPVGYTVGTLSPQTTYTVVGVFNSPTAGCPSNTAQIGTFTTR